MPKGKAKTKNPTLYAETPYRRQPSSATQAVAHRRGGTHRVRDEDKTNSVYDQLNYQDLLEQAKERKVYQKDMKKVEMARALVDNDLARQNVEHSETVKRQKEDEERRKEKQRDADQRHKQMEAKRKWRTEKEQRRQLGESVSDDTMSENEIEEEHKRIFGIDAYTNQDFCQAEVLSDESWDSTSTESTAKSVNEHIHPDWKLRIFEWPFPDMPPDRPSSKIPIQADSELCTAPSHSSPWKIPYAPLKVVTTLTKKMLFLPGQKCAPGIDPDHAPILSPKTKRAARNGILQGALNNATIEKGADWAKDTQVQGWNGRMYFSLPSHNKSKDLARVYRKWSLENRKLLRVKGRGNGVPTDRAERHAQRRLNKGKRTLEVYEASQYRPLAICYMPAYLDFGSDFKAGEDQLIETHRSIENLFFLRYHECDVPHYYFWGA